MPRTRARRTASEDLDSRTSPSVEDYLRAAVARLVPARNEAAVAIIDGQARFRPATLSGFDISGNQQLIDRAIDETDARAAEVIGHSRHRSGVAALHRDPGLHGGRPAERHLRARDRSRCRAQPGDGGDHDLLDRGDHHARRDRHRGLVRRRPPALAHPRPPQRRRRDHARRPVAASGPAGQRRHLRPDAHRQLDARSPRRLGRRAASAAGRRAARAQDADHDRARPSRDDGPRRRRRRRADAPDRHRRTRPHDPPGRRHRPARDRGRRWLRDVRRSISPLSPPGSANSWR